MARVDPELVKQFVRAAQEAAATVEKIPATPRQVHEALNRAVGENTANLAEPCALAPEFFAPFKSQTNVVAPPTDHHLATVRIGVTDAFAGVARTGSICIPVDDTLVSSVSLFCREHIAVLDARNLVPRPRDLFSGNYFPQNKLPSNLIFITGPSATADMGELVRGVHGPGKLHIILLVP